MRPLILVAHLFFVSGVLAFSQECPPALYNSLPRDSEDWFYGAGKGVDAEAARQDALKNLIFQATGGGGGLPAEAFASLQQDHHDECRGEHYVLVRIKRSDVKRVLSDLARKNSRKDGLDQKIAKTDDLVRKLSQKLAAFEKAEQKAPVINIINNLPDNRPDERRGDGKKGDVDRFIPWFIGGGIILVVAAWLLRPHPPVIVMPHPGLPPGPNPPPAPPQNRDEVEAAMKPIRDDIKRGKIACALEKAKEACLSFSDQELSDLKEKLEAENDAASGKWFDGSRNIIRCPDHPQKEPGNSGLYGQRVQAIKKHLEGQKASGGHALEEPEAQLRAKNILAKWEANGNGGA